MLTKVHTVATLGFTPQSITIEVHTTAGLPKLLIIGLANKAIQEAKDRIRSALRAVGVRFSARRTIVNLTPAGFHKSGSAYDLPIAVGLINVFHHIQIPTYNTIFLGEIGLTGDVLPIERCLLHVLAAKKLGYQNIVIPSANLAEVSVVDGINIYGLSTLHELLAVGDNFYKLKRPPVVNHAQLNTISDPLDLLHLEGQSLAIRSAVIAAAGRHFLQVIGTPGMGKTLLARFLHSLLPPLSVDHAIESTALHSLVSTEQEFSLTPPFRSPHCSATLSTFLGSSRSFSPGELSLAHHGLLFLDEFPRFNPSVIQGLMTPLDQKCISRLTNDHQISFPCDCLVMTAANPCPCGYWQSSQRACKCSLQQKQQYSKRMTGPWFDRCELFTSYRDQPDNQDLSLDWDQLKPQVMQAHEQQLKRYQNSAIHSNHDLTFHTIKTHCTLAAEADLLLSQAVQALRLSHRATEKCIAVAQTLADLEGDEKIFQHHLAEALQYRFENFW